MSLATIRTAAIMLAIGVFVWSGMAKGDASCWRSFYECSSSSCSFYCDDDRTYVIFGEIWKEQTAGWGDHSRIGWGVCYFDVSGLGKGVYRGHAEKSTTVTYSWNVYGDSTVGDGSGDDGDDDRIRLADPDCEVCGSDDGYEVIACGNVDQGMSYRFYGCDGWDTIWMCSTAYPTAAECNDYLATYGYGNDGTDSIYGSVYQDRLYGYEEGDMILGNGGTADWLFGGEGIDDVYCAGTDGCNIYGEAGNDYLHGGAGGDYFDCGSESDHASGYGGNDTIYGRDGADYLYGGTDTDNLQGGNQYDICYKGGTGETCSCEECYNY